MDRITGIIVESIECKKLVKGTFSTVVAGVDEKISKFSIKPIILKGVYSFQVEYFVENKAYHKNFQEDQEAINFILPLISKYKNINIFTTDGEYNGINNKGKIHLKSKLVERAIEVKEQNKKKSYIIPEGEPIPFLYDLGIMDSEGKVLKSSYSKFRQINRYLEFIRDVIDELKEKKLIGNELKVVDFGSGKSYLTFVLYYYLKVLRGMEVDIIGLDLKSDVMEECGKLSEKYGFSNLEFLTGNIKDFDKLKDADLIFSLHACNTATDYALLKGLELNAKAILAVPCCQNEFTSGINKSKESPLRDELAIVTNYGIIQEKVASLLTDGFRAEIMGMCGFESSVIEFIDTEHTPKNLLIKCIKSKKSKSELERHRENVESTMRFLGIKPIIFGLLEKYFI